MLLSRTMRVTPQKTKNVTTTIANVLNADGENEGNIVFNYEYNIYGSPTSQTDSYGTETTIEYDIINRPVKYKLPNGGTQKVEYNTKKNYAISTDAAGIKLQYNYDGIGRTITVQKNNSTIEEYGYDTAGMTASKISYLTSTTGTKEEYKYDFLGRMTERKVYELPSNLLYTETYTYTYPNRSDNMVVTKTTSASGASVATQNEYYDKYGRVVKTESVSGSTTLATSYEYDYLGRVTKETDPNGNETTYEYDCQGNVTKLTNAAGDSVSTI